MEFEVGIRQGMSYADYDRIPALRSHVLADMLKSPAHARYALDHPKPRSDAMMIGEAVHTAILEPDRFKAEYISRPDANQCEWAGKHKSSKAYKEGYELWSIDQEEKVILSPAEWKMCCALRDSAYQNPIANKILSGPGMNEAVVCWLDPGTNLPCKARLDRVFSHEGNTIVLDIKTTRDASPWSFAYDCAKFKYHFQGAYYRRGLKVLEPRPRPFWILALEKNPPYCSAMYRLDEEALNIAEASLQNLIYRFSECEEESNWPGYSSEVSKLFLPKFAYFEEGQDDD